MAKISLICEQCGGNLVLDNSHGIGTCEHCLAQFVIKQDQIVQQITQNITKYVYGYQGKDVAELLVDGYQLMDIGDNRNANTKFKQAIEIEPKCWSAWLGYASTGGDRIGYLSIIPAYRRAYSIAEKENQEMDTFVDMTRYLPDRDLRTVFIRAYNTASGKERHQIFDMVSSVIGCDDTEIASLAIDLCPNDWRAFFSMAKFRQIRAKWCELEGGLFSGKHLPAHAIEVLNIFLKAYHLAREESLEAATIVHNYCTELGYDPAYAVFSAELQKQLR